MIFLLHVLFLISPKIKDTIESNTSASDIDFYLCIDNGSLLLGFITRGATSIFLIVKFPFFESQYSYTFFMSLILSALLELVAIIKTLLTGGSFSPVNCCHRVIAERSLSNS